MFSLLGVAAGRGRTFAPSEEQPVVVLAWSLWQSSFGGRPDILGRQITVDGVSYTVIGVMPRTFRFAPFWVTGAQMWTPFVFNERRTDRTGQSLRVFARLKPRISVAQAQAEMDTIMSRLASQYPESSAKLGVIVTPLLDKTVGSVRPMLFILLGTVGFVLLIACANVANLMLARAAGRRREMAIRLAIGATPWHLVRQAAAESGLLAMIGGAAGLALAYLGLQALKSLLPEGGLPRQEELSIGGATLVFTLILTALTGLVSGMAPAWSASIARVNRYRRGDYARSVLAGSEIAMAFVLVIGAGLMVRSFARLLAVDPGFNPSHLLTMEVSVAGAAESNASRRTAFYAQAMEGIQAVPGVRFVSAINHVPISGDVWGFNFQIEGRPLPLPGESPNAVYRVVGPNYFRTMEIAIQSGRDFTLRDNLRAPSG